MSLKSIAALLFAKHATRQINKWASTPVQTQERVFKQLINTAKNTSFGKDHEFDTISSHQEFVKKVPIRDYEGLKSYVDRVVAGELDILWPGKPLYFAKTSGTTSGAKYIPLTKESMSLSKRMRDNQMRLNGKRLKITPWKTFAVRFRLISLKKIKVRILVYFLLNSALK